LIATFAAFGALIASEAGAGDSQLLPAAADVRSHEREALVPKPRDSPNRSSSIATPSDQR